MTLHLLVVILRLDFIESMPITSFHSKVEDGILIMLINVQVLEEKISSKNVLLQVLFLNTVNCNFLFRKFIVIILNMIQTHSLESSNKIMNQGMYGTLHTIAVH